MPITINDFPGELLIEVFTNCLYATKPSASHQRAALALVSKYWKSVCYNTPTLWTIIDNVSTPEANSFAIVKSDPLPLDVSIKLINFPREDASRRQALVKLAEHLPRWKTTWLRMIQADLDSDEIQNCLAKPAPILEELTFWVMRSRSHSSMDLFEGRAEMLKSINLYNFALPWNSGLYSGLDRLSLLYTPPKEGPGVVDIMRILAECPQLEELRLHHTNITQPGYEDQCMLDEEDQVDLAQAEKAAVAVHLPRLTTLELVYLDSDITNFLLRSIQSPPCERFVVEMYSNVADDPVSTAEILPNIAPFLPPISDGEIMVQLLREEDIQCSLMVGKSMIWSLTFHGEPAAEVITRIIAAIPAETLSLPVKVAIPEESTAALEEFLAAADRLHITSLDLQPDSKAETSKVLKLLSERVDGRYWLPGLTELEIFAPVQAVRPVLETRWRTGQENGAMPLENLRILEETTSYSDADRLVIREIVPSTEFVDGASRRKVPKEEVVDWFDLGL